MLVHVADDDEAIRKLISFMLKTSGYEVRTYRSGIELLKRARELEPGCIALDVRMPALDGLETMQALRDKGVGLPVIFMTGHGETSLAVQAMKAGAVDFIEKPFTKQVLLDAVAAGFARLAGAGASHERTKSATVQLQTLTPRERDILDGMANGMPNKTIAFDLGISSRTVEAHRANLMAKLQARSLSDALRLAFAARGQ